jgi:hypothetical protein
MVFPQGYRESWNIVSERSKAEDRRFIEAIVAELAKADNVDPKNFTIMGSSNGSALVSQLLIESDLLSPITSKCTTCDHFKVHHFGWGISGGLRGGWQGANAFRGEVFQSARPRPLGPMR